MGGEFDFLSFLTTMAVSMEAVCSVILVAASGYFLLHRNIMTYESSVILSKVVFHMFLPCLLFFEIARALNIDNVVSVLPVIVYYLGYLALCFTVGQAVSALFVRDRLLHRPAVISMTFGNTSYFPLMLLLSLDWEPFVGDPEGSVNRGVLYIATLMIVSSILFWSVGHLYLKTGPSLVRDEPDLPDATTASEAAGPGEIEMAVREGDSGTAPASQLPAVGGSDDRSLRDDDGDVVLKQVSKTPIRLSNDRPKSAFRTTLGHIVTPPLVACLFGVLVGLVPQLKWLFFEVNGHRPWLRLISTSISTLAGATLPSGMIVIGASIYMGLQETARAAAGSGGEKSDGEDPASAGPVPLKFSGRAQIAINVSRLFVLPLVATGVMTAVKFSGLDLDPMVMITCLLTSCMPTSPNLVVLAQVAELTEVSPAIARIVFYQYLLSTVSVTLFLFVQLYIVFRLQA